MVPFTSLLAISCFLTWYLSSLCFDELCLHMFEIISLRFAKFSCCLFMLDSWFSHVMFLCAIQGSPKIHFFFLSDFLASGNSNERDFFFLLRCGSCWQLPQNLWLLSLELWTFGSDVTDDAAVMIGRQTSFVWILLDNLCSFKVSILTNNIALTFYMSAMQRDIFRWGRIFNVTFRRSILLNPRPVGFQKITIWSNMTNLSTIMTSKNKLTLCSWFLGLWHHDYLSKNFLNKLYLLSQA